MITFCALGASTLDANHNDEDNNSGILAALGTLIVILFVGLIISIVVNIWLYHKNKRYIFWYSYYIY